MRVHASCFLLLLLLVVVDCVQAYAPRLPVARARCGGGILFEARRSPEDEKAGDDQRMNEPMEEKEAVVTALEGHKKGLTPIQKFFWALSDACSYALICFAVAPLLGFMLNVIGYSYQVSWEQGVEIETIGKMREINQFRAAVNARPPSSLPR